MSLLSTKKVRLNGDSKFRLYNVSNISFIDIDPFLINSSLKNVAFSQGSACNSNSIKPSHVLKAMGIMIKKPYPVLDLVLGNIIQWKKFNLYLQYFISY